MKLKKRLLPILCAALSSAAVGVLAGCASPEANETLQSKQLDMQTQKLLLAPVLLTNDENYSAPYSVQGSTLKRLTMDVEIEQSYANISVYDGDRIIADNLNIPTKGKHQLDLLVDFESKGQKTLTFVRRSADVKLLNVQFEDVSGFILPKFKDQSKALGFETEATYKYGGPSIGDVDNDGDYDLVLNNHNHVPTQLVTNNGSQPVDIKKLFNHALDFHGSTVGDYDNDGDLDILVAQGGANGTNPTSYILLKNENGKFVNASPEAGILTPARGRSPRWIDLDLDGDLDVALFNAKTPNDDGPRHLFYENNGDGTFAQKRISDIEHAAGERLLVTDFNHDNIDDIIVFSPITLWQGTGEFSFTDVTKAKLPKSLIGKSGYYGGADIDANNDGLLDLYVTGGRTHYQLSRKSIDFNPKTKRLDIRDDGEKGTTAVKFKADGDIRLSDMDLTYRQYNDGFAIFLGESKQRKIVKSKGFMPVQLPEEMKSAPSEMNISPEQATGWPQERKVNGLYIGHLGNGEWKAEWVRDQNIYWTVTFSLTGLNDVEYDWKANNRNVQDRLLINQGDKFVDATKEWNIPLGGNSWGVTRGDFNNDGWQDLFVYRYGYLKERVADLMLINNGKGSFETFTEHGAFDPADTGHGDMGQAFDFNKDGLLDMLNGSEEEGTWYMYNNQTQMPGNYVLFDIGYSPKHNVDPYSAVVTIETDSGKKYQQRVSSAGAVHSQSLLDIVHFGLGDDSQIKSANIRWRNGETVEFNNLKANRVYKSENAQ